MRQRKDTDRVRTHNTHERRREGGRSSEDDADAHRIDSIVRPQNIALVDAFNVHRLLKGQYAHWRTLVSPCTLFLWCSLVSPSGALAHCVCACVLCQFAHVRSLESRSLDFSQKLESWHLGRLFSAWLDRHRRLRWRRQRTHLILQAVRSLWQKNAFMAWQHYVLAVHNQRKEFVLARVLYAWKLLAKREKDRRKEARADAEVMQQVDRERATHRNPHMSRPVVVAPAPVLLPFVDDQKYSDDRSSDDVLAPAFSPSASASGSMRSPLAAAMGIGQIRTPRGSALSPADLDDERDDEQRPAHTHAASAASSSPYAALSFRAASLTSLIPPLAAPPLPMQRSLHESMRMRPDAAAAAVAPPTAVSPQWRLTPFRPSSLPPPPSISLLSNQLPPAHASPESVFAMSRSQGAIHRPTEASPARSEAAAARSFHDTAATSSSARIAFSPPRARVSAAAATPSPRLSRSRQRQDEMAADRARREQQLQIQLLSPNTATFVKKLFAD